jgi:hypothetical protein
MRKLAQFEVFYFLSSQMPIQPQRYYFDVGGPGQHNADRHGASLSSDDAALAYATRIIHELKVSGGYDDPACIIVVRCLAGEVILSIPF